MTSDEVEALVKSKTRNKVRIYRLEERVGDSVAFLSYSIDDTNQMILTLRCLVSREPIVPKEVVNGHRHIQGTNLRISGVLKTIRTPNQGISCA